MRYDIGLQVALTAAGGPTALARALGLVPSAVTQWATVPPLRVPAVSRITGVPRHVLRPDLYDPPETSMQRSNAAPMRGQDFSARARNRVPGARR